MGRKKFPTPVVVSVTTGFMLCDKFDSIHECIEFVCGHPVWTHELADRAAWNRVKESIFAQHPQLRDFTAEGCGRDNAEAFATAAVIAFGSELTLSPGSDQRTESPLESLERIAPGKQAIVVTP